MKQKRKWSQVFLHDPNIIRKIIDFAAISNTQHSLEIGCGEGILSKQLATQSNKLTIIDIDPDCIEATKQTCSESQNINYILQDILTVDMKSIKPLPVHIIANIPYHISAPLIQHIVAFKQHVKSCTLMVQKEFADKCLANPNTKTYTSFSIFCQYHFKIEKGFTVKKRCFYPVPKVDSYVLKFKPKESLLNPQDEELLFKLIKASFWARRKQMITCLLKNPYTPYPESIKTLPFFKGNSQIRAESCQLADFIQLSKEIKSLQEPNY